MTTLENTGWVAYSEMGGHALPLLLAFEADEEAAARDAAKAEIMREIVEDEREVYLSAIVTAHVDLVNSASDYSPDDWVLVGWPYVPEGYGAAVRHGARKVED